MFLRNTSKIPKSKVLTMGLKLMGHATEPSMLHLLRRRGSTTKLVIELIHMDTSTNVSFCFTSWYTVKSFSVCLHDYRF
jgi:hypothetical protein